MSQKEIRVRIAPSPTGSLHLGTVRTALYNYLFAKKNDGKFILRIEDTDLERNKDEYTKEILDGFKWLKINFDEGPYYQSERLALYRKLAQELLDEGKAYQCFCTQEELDGLRKIQRAAKVPEKYDNRHRKLTEEQKKKFISEDRKPVIRFKLPDNTDIKWHDEIRGDVSVNTNDLGGDPVIIRADGIPLYNFAVVVDDGDMKISHVIRGDDHLHNTAKQIPIFQALGYVVPTFAHAPLIFTHDKEKLSKRKHGDIANIDKYQREGYLPEALANYLVHMSWTKPDKPEEEIFRLDEIVNQFSLDRISKSPAIYDLPKLNWFNNHYIKEKSIEEIYDLAKPFFVETFGQTSLQSIYSKNQILHMLDSVRSGVNKLDEIPALINFFFDDNFNLSTEENLKILNTESAKGVLDKTLKNLDKINFQNQGDCKKAIDEVGKELNLKGKDLYWPLRVALSGSNKGPDLGLIISLLGREKIKSRIEKALSVLV
ncbi:MAG: glutamate--tRNA ligase [Candidatus Melainabacteria bacterium]|nr:glutamate--tRNA ligase [Candidatus Melainabacteria bacterium]